jgi:hypothetical protein
MFSCAWWCDEGVVGDAVVSVLFTDYNNCITSTTAFDSRSIRLAPWVKRLNLRKEGAEGVPLLLHSPSLVISQHYHEQYKC